LHARYGKALTTSLHFTSSTNRSISPAQVDKRCWRTCRAWNVARLLLYFQAYARIGSPSHTAGAKGFAILATDTSMTHTQYFLFYSDCWRRVT